MDRPADGPDGWLPLCNIQTKLAVVVGGGMGTHRDGDEDQRTPANGHVHSSRRLCTVRPEKRACTVYRVAQNRRQALLGLLPRTANLHEDLSRSGTARCSKFPLGQEFVLFLNWRKSSFDISPFPFFGELAR